MQIKLFLVIFLLWGITATAQIKTKLAYDEFIDVTSFHLDAVKIKSERGQKATLIFWIANKGKALIKPEDIFFVFTQMSSDWQYLSCTQTNFMFDTTRIDLGKPEHIGNIIGSSVLEQMIYQQPFSFLEKMTQAKIVRFKICNAIFSIDPKSLEQIKMYHAEILKKMNP